MRNMASRYSARAKRIITKVIIYAVLLALAYVMLYPLALLINMSFKSYREFLSDPIGWVKLGDIKFDNYKTVYEKLNFLGMFLNSVFYSTVSAVISCVIALLAAFPLSRKHFKGSGGDVHAVYCQHVPAGQPHSDHNARQGYIAHLRDEDMPHVFVELFKLTAQHLHDGRLCQVCSARAGRGRMGGRMFILPLYLCSCVASFKADRRDDIHYPLYRLLE